MNPIPASGPTSRLPTRGYRNYVLIITMLVFATQYLDRQIVVILAEPLKAEFQLSDAQLGLLSGFVFSIPYSLMLIPVGMMVDRYSRRNLLAAALLIWSGLTFATGFTRNLGQLIAIRFCIAGAEAANNPTSVSMLADLYGKRRRATAIGIFYAGPAVATVLGFAAIGAINAHWGWRTAFFAAGMPGLLLGLLVLMTVREPARGENVQVEVVAPPLRVTLGWMTAQRSVLHLLVAMGLTSIVNSGQIAFLSPFLIRVHGMSVTGAATTISIAYGIVLTIGQIFGGALVDRLSARDPAWIGRASALCAVIAGLAMLGATLTPSLWFAVLMVSAWALPAGCVYGPVLGALQGLVKSRMRGVANAVMGLIVNLIGAGLGPLIAGKLSDLFAPSAGSRSIAYAMACLAPLEFWAATHFFTARRSLRHDMGRVEEAVIT